MTVSRFPLLAAAGALAAALALVACGGGNEDAASTAPPPSAGAPAPGGGLSIAEALASSLEGPLAVRGYLVALEGETPRLCSALLESYPPQCGSPSLALEGVDLSSIDGLRRTDDPSLASVTWSESEISLLGTVEDGVLTVSATSI